MNTVINNIDKIANKHLYFLDNKYIRTSILTFLAIYVAIWSPRLPKQALVLFENNVFRLFVFVMALFVSTKDLGISLMISLAFLVSIIGLRKYNLMDIADEANEQKAVIVDDAPINNKRNGNLIYYGDKTDNDSDTLINHMYDPNGEEAPGFLDDVENGGISSSAGENTFTESFNETVVGALLHSDDKHSGAQGLQHIGGMEGSNIGSWSQH